LVLGRPEEALTQLRIADKTDPLSSEAHYNLAYGLTSAGRTIKRHQCEKLRADYANKPECLGRARIRQGRIGDASQVLAPLQHRGNRGYLLRICAGGPSRREKGGQFVKKGEGGDIVQHVGPDARLRRYTSRKDNEEALRSRLRELVAVRVPFGYRPLTVLLKREGWMANAKHIYRAPIRAGVQSALAFAKGLAALRRADLPQWPRRPRQSRIPMRNRRGK
jgi:hypothetical protein